jgi:hypothetical protein
MTRRETREVYNSNLEQILKSDERYIELLIIIANEGYQLRTPDFIRKKLHVTKKDLCYEGPAGAFCNR